MDQIYIHIQIETNYGIDEIVVLKSFTSLWINNFQERKKKGKKLPFMRGSTRVFEARVKLLNEGHQAMWMRCISRRGKRPLKELRFWQFLSLVRHAFFVFVFFFIFILIFVFLKKWEKIREKSLGWSQKQSLLFQSPRLLAPLPTALVSNFHFHSFFFSILCSSWSSITVRYHNFGYNLVVFNDVRNRHLPRFCLAIAAFSCNYVKQSPLQRKFRTMIEITRFTLYWLFIDHPFFPVITYIVCCITWSSCGYLQELCSSCFTHIRGRINRIQLW